MSGEVTVVVALVGGVGGALLTGIFNAAIGVLADKRRKQHELDAWLRERRFQLMSDLLDFINESADKITTQDRNAMANVLQEKYARLMLVIPRSNQQVLMDSVRLIAEELRGEFSLRSAQSIAWQSGTLQYTLSHGMGWDSEPVGGYRPPGRWRRRLKAIRRRVRAEQDGK